MADEWDDDLPVSSTNDTNAGYKTGNDNKFADRPPRNNYSNNENGEGASGRFNNPRNGGGDYQQRRFNRDDNNENGDGDRPRRRFNRDDNNENGDGERPRRRFNRDENNENGDGDKPRRRFNRDDNNENGDGERPRRRFNRDENNENGDGDKPRRRFNKDGDDENEEKSDKPREIYIPPAPTEDENEIFEGCIKSGINFDQYDRIPISVSENVAKPITSFQSSGLNSYLLKNVQKCGYARPTPIQKYAIPTIMEGKDLMACAQTGSGKTAAFILPILHTLFEEKPELDVSKPHVIILAPTRELAIQIFNEARKFAFDSYLKIGIAYGGTSMRYQIDNILKGVNMIVATPGRLLDLVGKGLITCEALRFVVLDEADRMLDMGFMPSVETLMNHPTMRPKNERNTLMFSATFPEEIQRLAGNFLDDYAFIAVGVIGSACSDVEQRVYEVSRFKKRNKLIEILESEGAEGVIVFVNTQRMADLLASFLSETSFPTTSIHGARLQREREKALSDFRNGTMKVLIATSVANRGLDIKNVSHVINFDLPNSIDEYVHRIGRTGRVGNKGKATSFYDPDNDSAIAPELVRILKQADQEVPAFLGTGSTGMYKEDAFGATDIRGGNTDQFNRPQPLENEEEW